MARVPLSDAENLAVGAFGGIVETCVQSASCEATRSRRRRSATRDRSMWINKMTVDETTGGDDGRATDGNETARRRAIVAQCR